MFVRPSFSGTDGLDRFFVKRHDERLLLPFRLEARLAQRAKELTIERYRAEGVTNITCATAASGPH